MIEAATEHRADAQRRDPGQETPASLKIGEPIPFADAARNLDHFISVFEGLGGEVKARTKKTTVITFPSGIYSSDRRSDGSEGTVIHPIGNVNLVIRESDQGGVEGDIKLWKGEKPVAVGKSEITVKKDGGVIFSTTRDDNTQHVVGIEQRKDEINNTSIKTGPYSYSRVTERVRRVAV